MLFSKSIVVFVFLALIGCGSKTEKVIDYFYNCGGPKETPIVGAEASLEALKKYKRDESTSQKTEPSEKLWRLEYQDNHPLIIMDDETYIGYFNNNENQWRLKLSETDDQIFGVLYPFYYTVGLAFDSSHCSTSGFRFNIGGESYRFAYGIK